MNALQAKSLDLFSCTSHINTIVSTITDHRTNADNLIEEILDDAKKIAKELNVELTLPRIVQSENYRANHPDETASDYWKKTILIPYLDSLISALNIRFAESNTPAFSLLLLHPANMLKGTLENLKSKANDFAKFYHLDGLGNEIELWRNVWIKKELTDDQLSDLELCEVAKEADAFFPQIKRALHIAISQPCTTCTIERTFSTLRRVKTWLRSTMVEERLNGNKI